jgi:hypothetical protein
LTVAQGIALTDQFIPAIAMALVMIELGKHIALIGLAEPTMNGWG